MSVNQTLRQEEFKGHVVLTKCVKFHSVDVKLDCKTTYLRTKQDREIDNIIL